jgi:phosphatidate phosphatase PAH1
MLRNLVIALVCLSACEGSRQVPVTDDPNQCAGSPSVDQDADFRHTSSSLVAHLGDPHHRGLDLITTDTADTQTLSGWIKYSDADKSLEDEDVHVFACMNQTWTEVGTARTSEEGRFDLQLTGDARLTDGLRDMYLSVVGDATGAAFLAYVAPEGTPLVISDVDGTLTGSENQYPESLAAGTDVDVQPNAAAAFQRVTGEGLQIVYITARGNRFTDDTRQWLADQGFPRGPVRLVDGLAVLPGQATIDYKTNTMAALTGFSFDAGIGNRDSDITAYTNVGIAADHILIKLPEFEGECWYDLDQHKAIGFDDYANLPL